MKNFIRIRNATTNTLKNIDLEIPKNVLTVFCGPSGSGKSSLAYETLFPEGRYRYVKAISPQIKCSILEPKSPDFDSIEGLTPTIATEQKSSWSNPRSTVGTLTEISHYLQILFAHHAVLYCPESQTPLQKQNLHTIIENIKNLLENTNTHFSVCAPQTKNKKGSLQGAISLLIKKGYTRIRINKQICSAYYPVPINPKQSNSLDVCVDRFRAGHPLTQEHIAQTAKQALSLGKETFFLLDETTQEEHFFSLNAYSTVTKQSFPDLLPCHFSHNSTQGMCLTCQGIGTINEWDIDAIVLADKSVRENCCIIASKYNLFPTKHIYEALERHHNLNLNIPWKQLPEDAKKAFLYGVASLEVHFTDPISKHKWKEMMPWEGALQQSLDMLEHTKRSKRYDKFLKETPCPSCLGARIQAYPAAAKLRGKTFFEICTMQISDLFNFFTEQMESSFCEALLQQIRSCLQFLIKIGLEYLILGQSAKSLSGGESQRVRLAAQVGSGLAGITYIFDEPSIGLHAQDVSKLIHGFQRLRDQKNSVIVIEHDETVILSADLVVEFGPGGGNQGGNIVFSGTPDQLLKSNTLTAQNIHSMQPKKCFRTAQGKIILKNVRKRNLKGIDVSIPTGIMVGIAGVSGSGKSTLIREVLLPLLENVFAGNATTLPCSFCDALEIQNGPQNVVAIDQRPIGKMIRSNPATYTKVFNEIRLFFSELPESKSLGFRPGRFSFNVKEGTCSVCGGLGYNELPIDQGSYECIRCTYCKGLGFDEQTLSVRYKGKNIADVLQMTVDEAAELFAPFAGIQQNLRILQDICLGYLKLGLPSPMLSGGEAQRIKLAKALANKTNKTTLYTLDEPTTGLHSSNIQDFLRVLNEIVDRGDTVLVIEHNPTLLASVDWIIELGEGGGKHGGKIIATGTPEEIKRKNTPTGIVLREGTQSKRIPPSESSYPTAISLQGVDKHNFKLKQISIPTGSITTCYGKSGSGKSTFAIEVLGIEGQRRYINSLPPYIRQNLPQKKEAPKIEMLSGLTATVCIEPKQRMFHPRSTVGTMTKIYDMLRVVYTRVGIPHCPVTGEQIKLVFPENVIEKLNLLPPGTKVEILAPIRKTTNLNIAERIKLFFNNGFSQAIINGENVELSHDLMDSFSETKSMDAHIIIDRIKVGNTSHQRWLNAIEKTTRITENIVIARINMQEHSIFHLGFSVPSSGKMYPKITKNTFSFNLAEGQCPFCKGIGLIENSPQMAVFQQKETVLVKDFLSQIIGHKLALQAFMREVCAMENIDIMKEMQSLTDSQKGWLWRGGQQTFSLNENTRIRWRGIYHILLDQIQKNKIPKTPASSTKSVCPFCDGSRLNPLARNVLIDKISIDQLCAKPIKEAKKFLMQMRLDDSFRESKMAAFLKTIIRSMSLLIKIGLGDLQLARAATDISQGELQRIRFVQQLDNGLSDLLYILKTPSLGSDPDNYKNILDIVQKLKAEGNTILLLDNKQEALAISDYMLLFEKDSDKKTLSISYEGLVKPDMAAFSEKQNLTVKQEQQTTAIPWIECRKPRIPVLKKISWKFPEAAITCVTGVSGAGKSVFLKKILWPLFSEAKGQPYYAQHGLWELQRSLTTHLHPIFLDENPTYSREADILSYLHLHVVLQNLFSITLQAKKESLTPAHFNPNSKLGMCPECSGIGHKTIRIKFFPDSEMICPECNGNRLNALSLSIKYKNKNYSDFLKLSAEQLITILPDNPTLLNTYQQLQRLQLVDLPLGRKLDALSKGELQRLILLHYFPKNTEPHILLLDDPTQGLHPFDSLQMVLTLQNLVSMGHTVVCATHDPLLVASANHMIVLKNHVIANACPYLV